MELPNFTFLGKGFYVCRTQAGFRKALMHFTSNDAKCIEDCRGCPVEYPSFVALSWGYVGYSYVIATGIHINELREKLNKADPV